MRSLSSLARVSVTFQTHSHDYDEFIRTQPSLDMVNKWGEEQPSLLAVSLRFARSALDWRRSSKESPWAQVLPIPISPNQNIIGIPEEPLVRFIFPA